MNLQGYSIFCVSFLSKFFIFILWFLLKKIPIFKNSKIVRAIRYAMKIRVVLQYPALPEGKGENY